MVSLQKRVLGIQFGGLELAGQAVALRVDFPGWKKSFIIDRKGAVVETGAEGDVHRETQASKWIEGLVHNRVRLRSGEMVERDDPRLLDEV